MARAELTVKVDPRLDIMFRAQIELQRTYHGMHPGDMSDEQKMAYIREQALALIVEIGEALKETGWKSWASSNHIDRDKYVSELGADAMRFLINMLLVAGVDPGELFRVFMAKAGTVMDRATNGYDGVTGKCPRCRRDLGDTGVTCYRGDAGEPKMYWCDEEKGWYNYDGYPV